MKTTRDLRDRNSFVFGVRNRFYQEVRVGPAQTSQVAQAGAAVRVYPQVAAVAIIVLQISVTIGAGYILFLILTQALGSQPSIDLPLSARLLGLTIIAAGVGVGLYTFRYRHPAEMLASTAVTLMKLVRRKPIGSVAGRTESFNPTGLYQYTRNPLYFGVVVLSFGFGIAVSSVLLLLWCAVLMCWFWFFLIPFEERELEALFGEDYSRYKRHVPKLPYRGRYRG